MVVLWMCRRLMINLYGASCHASSSSLTHELERQGQPLQLCHGQH